MIKLYARTPLWIPCLECRLKAGFHVDHGKVLNLEGPQYCGREYIKPGIFFHLGVFKWELLSFYRGFFLDKLLQSKKLGGQFKIPSGQQ